MKLSDIIENEIKEQGRTKTWVADQIGTKEKTFYDRLKNDRLTAIELLKLGKILNIDLEKLKNEELD